MYTFRKTHATQSVIKCSAKKKRRAECGVQKGFSCMLPRQGRYAKAYIFACTCFIFTALFLTNCSKLRDNFDIGGVPNLKPPIATDYSLESSGCTWNFANFTEDSLYIIEDSLELLNFISCTGSYTPPEIDFSKYSLLFVHGNATRGIFSIDKNYERFAMLEYKLDIKILLNDTVVPKHWHTAMLVPKLPQNATVVLNVSINCVDTIPFTNYSLGRGNFPNFDTIYLIPSHTYYYYGLVVVNSKAEMLTFMGDTNSSIDFSNYTLLGVCGNSPHIPSKIDIAFSKNHCTNQYILNVETTGFLTMIDYWYISILTPKIDNSTDIILNVKHY